MPKICPLLSLISISSYAPSALQECKETSCAWWLPETELSVNGVNTAIPGKCAVTEAGSSLGGMVCDGIFMR